MVLYDGGDNIMNRDTLKQIMIDQKEIYHQQSYDTKTLFTGR